MYELSKDGKNILARTSEAGAFEIVGAFSKRDDAEFALGKFNEREVRAQLSVEPEIINGDVNAPAQAIGYIESFDGGEVAVRSRSPEDVRRAAREAAGSYPTPLLLGPGSHMVIVYPNVPVGAPSTPQMMVDSTGSDNNKIEAAKWNVEAAAWHKRYTIALADAEAVAAPL